MTKVLGIDVRMAFHTGIGRYLRGLIPSLKRRGSFTYELFGGREGKKFFTQFPFWETNYPIYGIAEQIVFPFSANHCDCLHVPHYNVSLFWRKKLVITIHDLIHLHFADDLNPIAQRYARFLLPLIAKKADAIITVSEYTKSDLIKTLNVSPEKITTIHHGVSPEFLESRAKRSVESHLKAKRYFLIVGLIKSHKNIGVVLDAFSQLKKKVDYSDVHLYLVGAPDLKQRKVQNWMEVIHERNDVSHLVNISDTELRDLYANASALIFPSLYEGFGFPILEAMASRIPVIAAQATSIPEVLGDAGLYFDPHSAKELYERMVELLRNDSLAEALVQKGLLRINMFRWDTAAKKTEEIYESVLGT